MPNLQVVKQKASSADQAQGTGGLLTKKVDSAVKVMMTKKVNPNQVWQVVLVGDKSYSMEDEYRRGTVQAAIEQALGFAVIVDDDGTVPAVFFGGDIRDYTVSLDDFHEYVQRNRIKPDGGTPMAQALRRVAQITGNGDLFTGGGFLHRGSPAPTVKKMDTPAFVIVVTDGAPNSDERRPTVDAVQRLSYRGIFLKFLYVGHDKHGWEFLESLDDDIPVGKPYEQGGRLVDNVDAKKVANLSDDSAFYEAMFDEVNTWLAAAKQHCLI